MSTARIKLAGETAVYHCISRIVGGQLLLDSLGKKKFEVSRSPESGFCGICKSTPWADTAGSVTHSPQR